MNYCVSYRKRLRFCKMQDVLAEGDKMILNKPSVQLDDHDKALLHHAKD